MGQSTADGPATTDGLPGAGLPGTGLPGQDYPAPGYPGQGYQASGVPGANPGYSGYPGQPAYPPYGYPVAVAPPTNGLSIASLVVSIVAVFGLCGYGLGGYLGIVGAILGHVSRKRIRERGENGDGMALAGIIVGWISTAIAVLATIAIVVFLVWLSEHDPNAFNSSY